MPHAGGAAHLHDPKARATGMHVCGRSSERKNLFCRATFHHDAVFREHHLVADRPREGHFVRDQHAGQAIVDQFADDVEHFPHRFWIERGRHFIEQDQFRFHGQRAGNGYALLLAARELSGVCARLVCQAHFLEQRMCGGFSL